ncbi:MAG: YtxH domain-containing protein [Bacteroidota bacterium]
MNKMGKWGLALGLATGAVLALTLTTRPGKRTRTESTRKTAKADIKAASLSNDDSEIHYV